VQSHSTTFAMQGGKQKTLRRAALGLYTEGLSMAKLLPHCGTQWLFNRTGLTSWAMSIHQMAWPAHIW